jgi:hypothetical protein
MKPDAQVNLVLGCGGDEQCPSMQGPFPVYGTLSLRKSYHGNDCFHRLVGQLCPLPISILVV